MPDLLRVVHRSRFAAPGVRWKILGPFAVLTVAFAVLGTYLATQLVTGSLEERFTNQLVESARAASDALVKQEQTHLEATRGVAFTEGVPDAVERGDSAEIERLIAPFAINAGAHQVEVLDLSGERLYGLHLVDPDAFSYAQLEQGVARLQIQAVADVVSGRQDEMGEKFAGLAVDGQEYSLFTAAPIRGSNEELVGVVLVSTPVARVLREIAGEALADLVVFGPESELVGSTFATGSFPEAEFVAPSADPASDEGGWRQRVSIAGREYDLLGTELRVRDEVAGTLAVALPTDYIAQAGDTTRLQMSVLFGIVTLAVLVVGLYIAQHFTGPVKRLANLANALSAGDLSARSNVRGRDEIGLLGQTFDSMAERLQRQQLSILGSLASAIDARDPYTAGHSLRVGQLSADIGRHLGMSPTALHHLMVGGYLHDIGKIGVRDSVLLKEGKLTDQEFELIKQHPRIGLDIIAAAELPDEVREIVGSHHEKLNGTGYPLGVAEEELSVFPRVASVADIYDALTTGRPYRRAMPVDEALALLEREASKGLVDPAIVSVIAALAEQWEERRRTDPLLLGFTLPQVLGRDAA